MITLFEEWVESDGQTITVTLPSNTYNITVTANSNINYQLNGNDRNGLVQGNDPTVTVQAGDTINFIVTNTFGHPFYIKTAFTGGSGNQVTTGTVTGTQGTQSGTLSWNTTVSAEHIIMFVLHMQLWYGWVNCYHINKPERSFGR